MTVQISQPTSTETKGTYAFISLGCPKNLVDSERMLGLLQLDGYQLVQDPVGSDFVIINTCGFIDDARNESLSTIDEMIALKRDAKTRGIIVSGCLAEHQKDRLLEIRPEIDALVGVFGREEITRVADRFIGNLDEQRTVFEPAPIRALPDTDRLRITPRHFAYLKISEGCDHTCSFCAIPSFKGKQRSVPPEILLEEACALVSAGAMEITLIGQDTVAYGKDLSQDRSINLRFLLERLSEIEGVQWLRVLYTYPTRLADELEWAYRNLPACIPYLDLPLQHLSDPVLVRMRRGTPYNSIRDHIGRLREAVPNLVVRSTCIVGFPGETEEDLAILQERFSELEVDHLGVFRYSDEEGTRGFDLPDKVDPEVAESRYEWMTAWAASFCQVRGGLRVGQEYEILVDRPALPPTDLFPEIEPSGQWWQGRWWGQAPEIDGSVFFRSETASVGRLVNVHLASVSYPDYLGAVVEL